MIVNICGIAHTVIEVEDNFDLDMHLGQIDYKRAEIRINKKASSAIKEETICHEALHGILVHIGREDLSEDETFVTSLANAIYQGFVVLDLSKIRGEK